MDKDRLAIGRIISHAGLAQQARLAVDLRAARAALPRFAIPTAGECAVVMSLNIMDGIQHHHARKRRHFVIRLASTGRIPSTYAECYFVHAPYLLTRIRQGSIY